MARACCLIRQQPHYRAEAFKSGLAAVGYDVSISPFRPESDDVLVIWNRYAHSAQQARIFEAAGARVVVAENGYLGRSKERQYYALALHRHNGPGKWHVGGERKIGGIEVRPWREGGDEIVILAQRGIGCRKVAQPKGWVLTTKAALEKETGRPVRVRPHPRKPKVEGKDRVVGADLLDDLANAWCAVTWGSCAGLKALVAGIPVFYGLPKWIGRDAAAPSDASRIESPRRSGRSQMLRKVAWAQWTVEEIASGQAFRHLL